MFRNLRLQQFYSPDSGAGTGASADPPAGNAEPTVESKFSQADVDRIVKERLGREAARASKLIEEAKAESVRQFRDEFGFDDEALEQWKQRDQAAAQQRALKTGLARAETEAKALATKHTRAMSALDRALCDAELTKELSTQECCDVESAVALLRPRFKVLEIDGEFKAVVVDERGEATTKTIAEEVKQLLDRKPNLKKAAGNFQGSGSRVTEGQGSQRQGERVHLTAEGRKASLAALMPDVPRPTSTLTKR